MTLIYFVHDKQENPSQRSMFLEQMGYSVRQFTSGNACLDDARKEKPDLVISDILIEGENGFEFCRKLRKTFSGNDLPVILTSKIYRARAFREEAKAVGAQAYFLRPIRLEELGREIGELTGGASAAAPPPLPPLDDKAA